MAPVVKKATKSKAQAPRILVVDDEPNLIELVGDVVGARIDCKLIAAKSIDEANKILASTPIELLVADVNLPDGNGTALVSSLKAHQPQATAIVITGQPSMDGAITAIREGAVDFLPKPFSADSLLSRVNTALERQRSIAKAAKRLDRLRDAVKRLNEARRLVSKKVDLLCNDLITAYGELSKQLDSVRTQEGFRKLLAEAKDLEQMLCHAMDWLLRQLGYSNVAIWLAGEEGEYQLGAYMKYTTAGEPALTEAMKCGILKLVNAESFIHLSADEAREKLSAKEKSFLEGQTIHVVTSTNLGEVLAAVVLFRDGKTPFTDDDAQALKAISPIFATALAGMVKDGDDEDDDGGSLLDEDGLDGGGAGGHDGPKPKKRDKTSDADWWKRGEQPPF
jgi:FixJ family two-component response regulator